MLKSVKSGKLEPQLLIAIGTLRRIGRSFHKLEVVEICVTRQAELLLLGFKCRRERSRLLCEKEIERHVQNREKEPPRGSGQLYKGESKKKDGCC